MDPMLNIAIKAARKAGEIIIKGFERAETIQSRQKGNNDFTTEIDIKAEQEIIYHLKKSYPSHSIIAEESGYLPGKDNDYTWIVDPLDGTSNFMRTLPHFAISIALKVKEQIQQAVIYDPLKQELFTATKGAGAQLNGRRLRIDNKKSLSGALVSLILPLQEDSICKKVYGLWEELSKEIAGTRRLGSAALDLAYVAASRIECYCEIGLKPWDLAAGSLIVREAGGLVGDFSGSESYLTSGNILAANSRIFASMAHLLEKHGLSNLK